ncbi:hypothetical protein SAICODRAFT_97302 [Saitoella complicata NRRL Y-17804]|uniref:Hydantoinase/oxoprolinase N-terminal domain-containing protein n=1 Tax=Saitoella complicata (strain BCRC 22490 / CBS 7301 / JCM 7358 / NBRC 10748 / NRRL Y-17804) TaxID=698492 RepID=A0A0E9N9R6_SAICN|nr:uncharacterized protein SAICODRAFT_97302 [Saitoella complicata NRRL Y-17804]ODQ50461.1 hypothetical protein SAICODRAFT_97302 [Saitoella complicata NRRL Y-17804]GAO46632.1 hypothetical protein G7K_0858-t1 [Saitoella complicata NRRL Y-17804]
MVSPSPSIRIGVDVGGTNTDSVLLDEALRSSPNRGIIAHFKSPTTPDVTTGIEYAVKAVLADSKVDPKDVASLTIGTTHFINAIVEQDVRRLASVGVIRLSSNFTRATPPFVDFPPALKEIMCGHYGWVSGGLQIDGSQIRPLKEDEIVAECKILKEKGLKNVVISGVYSPIDEFFKQEEVARKIVLRELGEDVNVVCSHEIANLGLLERENASILNASILTFAKRTIKAFRAAMRRLNLHCPLFLTQNDGTLVDAESASRLPIRTFSSGPTNSMRGAAYLSGLGEADSEKVGMVVVDIGGTTADVGMLLPSGFPRQASAYVTVAGVRINYSMPAIESIGLGGGSIVRVLSDGKVTVGPDSVGHYLTTAARVFGGETLTATDITVAAGDADVGNSSLVKSVEADTVVKAKAAMKKLLEDVVDLMKTSPEPVPVLLVGGGSIISPVELAGVSKVIRPPFHDVANAVGAAIAKVGGTVDTIENVSDKSVAETVKEVTNKAIQKAIDAGARPDSVRVAEVDTIPLQYVANQVRIVVKVAGDLDISRLAKQEVLIDGSDETDDDSTDHIEAKKQQAAFTKSTAKSVGDISSYRPNIIGKEWHLTETDVEWLADGCYVLGCAGGGNPYPEFLQLRDMIREGHKVRVVDQQSLKDDAVVCWGGHMGSPAVSVERLGADECVEAMRDLLEYMRLEDFDAAMGLEIGGGNGLQPLIIGSSRYFNRPVVDADLMGRAYPTYYQTTICVYEEGQLIPAAISSGDGRSMVMTKANDDVIVDVALRAACSEMGSRVGLAARPLTGAKVRSRAVLNTVSFAWRIGRAIALANKTNTVAKVADAIIAEAGGPETAKKLFVGKIVGVEQKLFKGHSYGQTIIEALSKDEEEQDGQTEFSGKLRIPFKNENILAELELPDGAKQMLATVPDLICVLDSQNGRALGVPDYRYGLRVTVIGIAASPRWTDTPRGLELGGPRAFGYDIDYTPLGVYKQPRSVIEEYGE